MMLAFALLTVALILKDTAPMGDSYVLRGLSEGTALLVGAAWCLSHDWRGLPKRYAWLGAYLLVLLLTVVVAARPVYVALQVLSLTAVIMFFIGLAEERRTLPDANRQVFVVVGVALILVCAVSLALYRWWPQWAYDTTVLGDRFKGVFGKPAMMGAAAGLLLGITIFARLPIVLRIVGFALAIPCLYLTGSRTFWAAAAVAIVVTGLRYLRHRVLWGLGIAVVGSVVLALWMATGWHWTSEDQAKTVRADSLEHLSGRTAMWALAMRQFRESPVLGFGFTTGDDAFKGVRNAEALSTAELSIIKKGSFTLHNGYVQALMDSGAIGAAGYGIVMLVAFWRVFRRDPFNRYAPELYGLVFLAVANVGETVIFSAAVFHAVLFWYLAVFAMSLTKDAREGTEEMSLSVADRSDSVRILPDGPEARSLPLPEERYRYPIVG